MPVSERTRLATLKARVQQAVQPAAERAAILGGGVGGLELAQDLRLADHHGIQAGGHAEQVMDGVAAFVPVEVRLDGVGTDGLVIGQEGIDDGLRVGAVVGGDRDLHAVAGGEDHGFADALARFQVGQRRRQGVFAEGQAFAHLDGCGLVAHAGDQQLHGLKQDRAQPRMRGPGEGGKAEHRDRHDGGFAAAPSGGGPQEHQGQVDAPGEEGDGDVRLADPGGLAVR